MYISTENIYICKHIEILRKFFIDLSFISTLLLSQLVGAIKTYLQAYKTINCVVHDILITCILLKLYNFKFYLIFR